DGLDLLYLPAWGSSLDWIWQWPHHARFLDRMAGFSRLILYDARGSGCSDRFSPEMAYDLDQQVEDALLVLDTVNSDACHVFAAVDSSALAIRLAARHP